MKRTLERTLERIEDVQDVVLGRYYDVPVVTAERWPRFTKYGKVIPVIGPRHEDAEIINFPDDHWHIDWRFVSTPIFRRLTSPAFSGKCLPDAKSSVLARPISLHNTTGAVSRKRALCRREMPVFPSNGFSGAINPWREKLEAKYADASAKCGICPHRGMPLAGAPVENGARVCSGHGLAWNLETGALQKR